MHNNTIMAFPDEVITVDKLTGLTVPVHNKVLEPIIEHTVPQLVLWAISDNGASKAFIIYDAHDIWIQHGQDPQVNICGRVIWLERVGVLDYKFADSKDYKCTELLDCFLPADAMHSKYPLEPMLPVQRYATNVIIMTIITVFGIIVGFQRRDQCTV